MHVRVALCAGLVAACCLAFASPASAAELLRFTTTDSNVPANDDGYDPAAVTVTKAANLNAPANRTDLLTGSVGLVRFFNTEWAGFSLSSNNGPAVDNATEFAGGYFTFTVVAQPGSQLNLSSLDFNSARGGGDPATQNRGFLLFAEPNGGTFDSRTRPSSASATRPAPGRRRWRAART